jgi:phage shock protein C
MFCTRCGLELNEADRFCSRCGNRNADLAATPAPVPLALDKRNKKVAGVCAGFAKYLGVDVVLVRVLWLGIALCTGVGFLVYLAAWIVLPVESSYDARPMPAARVPQNI